MDEQRIDKWKESSVFMNRACPIVCANKAQDYDRLSIENDRLRARVDELEREKADWERLYEKKRDSYDALLVAYYDLKAALEGGSHV